jgi:hypothetical protein
MPVDNIKLGTNKNFANNAGGATLITEPVIGVVKNNVDPTHSGMIEVYLSNWGTSDPDDPNGWVPVRYLSPFWGVSSPANDPKNGSDNNGLGSFLTNPQSYGWWASAPDIGTEVLCIFVDGLVEQGYYIGCVPKIGMLQMTPAIGSSTAVVPNSSEATTYGSVPALPTSEVNYANPAIRKNGQIYSQPKPVHSYQAAILNNQGIIRDPVRGVITSSAQRETPSRVFGMSTPGGPIYEGGYTGATVAKAVGSTDRSKLKKVGRTGGHSFVMDDGTLDGESIHMRLRSSGGHQITLSDTGDTIFIIHANGQSWVELGSEGTVDVFSTNSVNVRTQGDINFHADRDINMHAGRRINAWANEIKAESAKDTTWRVGGNSNYYTVGSHTSRVDGAMSYASGGVASFASSSTVFINGGPIINLNSGSASLVPKPVAPLTQVQHTETVFSSTVGWMNPGPKPLMSVTNRAPTHQPWVGGGKGVDVAVSPLPSTPAVTPASAAVASAVNPAAVPTVTPASIASVPKNSVGAGVLESSGVTAVTATVAATGNINPVNIASGLTPAIAEVAGDIKSGTASVVSELASAGVPMQKALQQMATAPNEVNKLIGDATAAAATVAKAIEKVGDGLVQSGAITGKEADGSITGAITGALLVGATTVTGAIGTAAKNAVSSITDLVKTGTSEIRELADSITSGKLASDMIAGIKSGINGLKDKVSGVTDLFSQAEASFGTLKGGLPNILSGSPVASLGDKISNAAADYDRAAAAVVAAQSKLFDIQREFRNDPSEANSEKLKAATTALSNARSAVTKASSSFAKNSIGTVTGKINGLLEGSISAVKGLVRGVVDRIDKLSESGTMIKGALDKLPTTLGTKLPPISKDTFDIAPLKAKMGTLLGDPKIPNPLAIKSASRTEFTPPPSASAESTAALEEVTNAESRVRAAKLNLSLTIRVAPSTSDAVKSAQEGLAREEALLLEAQRKYSSIAR